MDSITAKANELIGGRLREDREYKVKVYDFKRPDKFSRDQIRTVSIMHETFARLCTASLSAQLRSLVQVHVQSVDQLTYEEFIRSIPNPTTLAVTSMEPLKGSAILEIDPCITFSIIDRLFGGRARGMKISRDLTDIEQSVMQGIIVKMHKNLREAWHTVIDLKPGLVGIETNTLFAQIVPPSEMVVLVTLEMKVGDSEGYMNLCIPYLTIEPIIPKLSAQYWYSSMLQKGSGEIPESSIAGLKADAVLYYEGEKLSLKYLYGIKKNSLVKLPVYEKGEVQLLAGGSPVLKLKRMDAKKGKNLKFTVADVKRNDEPDWYIIKSVKKKETETDRMADLISGQVNAISNAIQEAMKDMSRKFSEISSRQDELSDQLYFNSPDRDIPAEAVKEEYRSRPFGFIRTTDSDDLYTLIQSEHPQTIAMILSYLDAGISSNILQKLAEPLQVDVAERIATLDRTPPVVLEVVEQIVEEKLKAMRGSEHMKAGGIQAITEILNLASRSVEKNVIETLQKTNSELAEDIKKRMFVIEDIVLLDNDTIKMILQKVDREDLLIALKTVDEPVREHILKNMPESDLKEVKSAFKRLGRIRLKEVESAQQRIVSTIRELEEAGAIVVARPDELV
jgi:flagellar motor switch protein FliM